MADFVKGRDTRTQGVELDRVFVTGEEAEFVFGRGTQLFPNLPVPIYGGCATRVVLDAAERWFEFGFRIDHELSGNAAAGFTDATNYFRIDPQWSLDLINWSAGKFTPAPVPVIDLGAGIFEYWSRAIHPVDSETKTGQLRLASSNASGDIKPDSRNNNFTSLVINNVSLALGIFPIVFPGDAASMQTALQSFYPGSTVTAASNVAWEIIIPGVTLSAFQPVNKLAWPIYSNGTDMLGNPTYSDGGTFDGQFVNSSGVAIHRRAFARLKISSGNRYDAYH